jgi:hypothetical protein
VSFAIRTAEALGDPALEARWAERRRAREGAALLRVVLRAFAERGGPLRVGDILPEAGGWPPARVRDELARLDRDDLLLFAEDEVRLAYPFSAAPTAFVVHRVDGRARYACCAIDALGIAAMLEERVVIRSPCHHCGEPLELAADAAGPSGADGLMVWVGTGRADERRVSASL